MERIYLDHGSACPVDPSVLKFARKYLDGWVGNASTLHSVGLDARRALEEAREKVARLVNAEKPECIVFTSGATEANNLAIRGTALRNASKGKEVVCSAIEHISVLNPMKELQKAGFKLTMIPVDGLGQVDMEKLASALTKSTTVTSIMYGNGEIGTIQPIADIAKLVHEKGGWLHVDATNAAGRIPIDVQRDGIDLLTLSSNDLFGPAGAGALYVKPGIRLQPIRMGGGQERGLSPGTENVFAIAGMGEAARLALDGMDAESKRLAAMRDALIAEITKLPESYLTGHPERRLPHHASFRFSGIEGESILLNMDMYNVQIATGSACSSRTLEPSHVLLAIGLKHEEAHGSMIVTLGRSNEIGQVPRIVEAVKKTVARLREMSPLAGK